MLFRSVILSSNISAVEHPFKDSYTVIPRDDLMMNVNYLFTDNDKKYDRGRLIQTDNNNPSKSDRVRDLNDVIDHETSLNSSVSETHSGLVRFSARLWNSEQDSVIAIYPKANKTKYSIAIGKDDYIASDKTLRSSQAKYTYGVSSDFTGSGTEQFVYLGKDTAGSWQAYLLKASDPDDKSQGVDVQALTVSGSLISYGTPVAADLDDDGNQEIAFLSDSGVVLWTVCAGNIADTDCEGRQAYDIINRGTAYTGGLGSGYSSSRSSNGLASGQILAGDFHDDGQELLVVGTFEKSNGDWKTEVNYLKFDNNLGITRKKDKDITGDKIDKRGGYVLAAKYRSTPWDNHESVVVVQQRRPEGNSSDINKQYFSFLDIDGTSLSVDTTDIAKDESYRIIGLAVGNFKDLPNEADAGDYAPVIYKLDAMYTYSNKLRLRAFEYKNDEFEETGDKDEWVIGIDDLNTYNGDAYAMNMPFRTRWDIKKDKGFSKQTINKLVLSDFRGKSEKLGSPLVVNQQENGSMYVKLSAPPAHVDYITGVDNVNTVVNMSRPVINNGKFYSEVTQSNEASVSSSHESVDTLSNTFMTSIKVEGHSNAKIYAYNVSAGASIETGGGASFEHKETDLNTNTNSTEFNITTRAYSSDAIAYQNIESILYYYPVIGQFVCADDNPGCSDDEKSQRYLLVTSPTVNSTNYVSADSLSWYQPVYETNNLLSYPSSFEQLEYNNAQTIHSVVDDNVIGIGGTAVDMSVNWKSDKSNSESEMNVSTGNWFVNMKQSVGVSAGVKGVSDTGVEVTTKQEYSGSDSTSNTVTSINQYSASTGVKVYADTQLIRDHVNYSYTMTPVIYGDEPIEGDGSSLNKTTASSSRVKEAIKDNNGLYSFTGPMRIGYYVNTKTQGGQWWKYNPYYTQAFDISLNNPTRWNPSENRDRIGNNEQNCLSGHIYGDCLVPWQPGDSAYTLTDHFYNMKGFYVESSDNTATRYAARDGEALTLKARIYNYSMKAMDSDRVKVQFYRQAYDAANAQLLAGSAVKIAETTLSAIPEYGNALAEVNWRYASVPFDTTGLGGQQFFFWVVAWPVDASGSYVTELNGKGLDMSGYSGADYSDILDVALEYVPLDYTEDGSDTESINASFTNNVGLYRQLFTVMPVGGDDINTVNAIKPASALAALSKKTAASPLSITADSDSWTFGALTNVVATINTKNVEGDLITYLVDETDSENKHILSIDRTALLDATNQQKVRFSFTPTQCGDAVLTLYVGGLFEKAKASQTLTRSVSCGM